MKISSHILFRKLRDKFIFSMYGSEGSDLVLERPLFLRHGADLKDDQIYLADESMIQTLPETKACSVLLYVGGRAEELLEFFDAVFVFRGLGLFDLYDAVQGIYSEYEEWDSRLRRMLNIGGNVQEMINASAAIFNNPLFLYDRNYSILALSDIYTSDPTMVPLMDKSYLAEFVNAPDGSEAYSKRRAVFALCATGVRSIYINIAGQNKFQYRLMALEISRKFNASDASLMEHLANIIQLAIAGGLSAEADSKTALSFIIKNSITGEYSDTYYIEKRLNEYDWKKEHHYFCVKISDTRERRGRNIQSVCTKIKELLPGACAFEYDNGAAVVVNLEHAGIEQETLLASFGPLGSFLQEWNLTAGISGGFSGFMELAQYFRQAELALSLGGRNKTEERLFHFRDVKELLLLDSCTRELPAPMVCAPEVITLRNYDIKHNTDYYKTLYYFLKSNLRPVQTIKELNIHRSTLNYRLERIEAITGLDATNCRNQWYLLLSFKLLEYADKVI
ncbi:MAG: helix-turn-helix domain-containing protein [Spirochaetaceae bacterium]|jgi:hypothetical protein|nr:helix-turn-helix domain-containing protein [Spirochaetaceae bacterium]